MELFDSVRENIYKYDMLTGGDYCIAAVSGGADSVCLLLLLARFAAEADIHLKVVHVNHMIRGTEADRDEAFVVALAKQLSIPCVVVRRPVPSLADEWGMTEEEAGRKVRYEAFRAELDAFMKEAPDGLKRPRGVIATAHNQDDLAETVIFNLTRGSGLSGMKGILPVREDIIRPLLYTARCDIEAYLHEAGQSWCTDSTNSDTEYTRNRIRHNIIPELRLINSNAVEHIARAARDAAEAESYISGQTEVYAAELIEERDGGISVPASAYAADDHMLWDHMIKDIIGRVCHGLKDIGRSHIDEVHKLIHAANGSSIRLPNGARVLRNNDRLIFYGREMTEPVEPYQICIDVPGTYQLPGSSLIPGLVPPYSLRVDIIEKPVYFDLIKKEYTKYLDYDKILHSIFLRPARADDTMVINASGGSKRCNRIFTDNKINEIQRRRLPVIAEGDCLIWIPGIRIGENYKVSDGTKRLLILELFGERTGNGDTDEGKNKRIYQ